MRLLAVLFTFLILTAPALACEAHLAAAENTGAPASPLSFHGFPCADDCSEHRAGFDWAAGKELTAEEECGGENSQSFTEGCIAWVRSLAADGAEGEMDEEYYAEPAAGDPISP